MRKPGERWTGKRKPELPEKGLSNPVVFLTDCGKDEMYPAADIVITWEINRSSAISASKTMWETVRASVEISMHFQTPDGADDPMVAGDWTISDSLKEASYENLLENIKALRGQGDTELPSRLSVADCRALVETARELLGVGRAGVAASRAERAAMVAVHAGADPEFLVALADHLRASVVMDS